MVTTNLFLDLVIVRMAPAIPPTATNSISFQVNNMTQYDTTLDVADANLTEPNVIPPISSLRRRIISQYECILFCATLFYSILNLCLSNLTTHSLLRSPRLCVVSQYRLAIHHSICYYGAEAW